jgi:predicted SprT family Zn-dependent metalloprotease
MIFQAPLEGQVPAEGRRPYTMPECEHCGAHVSERFARVFADERGHVYACPSCSANAGIAEIARQRAREV